MVCKSKDVKQTSNLSEFLPFLRQLECVRNVNNTVYLVEETYMDNCFIVVHLEPSHNAVLTAPGGQSSLDAIKKFSSSSDALAPVIVFYVCNGGTIDIPGSVQALGKAYLLSPTETQWKHMEQLAGGVQAATTLLFNGNGNLVQKTVQFKFPSEEQQKKWVKTKQHYRDGRLRRCTVL